MDSSSSKTGYAIFDNGLYKESGLIDFDTKEYKKKYKDNSEKRIEDMCLEIINVLKKYKPDIIVIEKLNVGRNLKTARILSKVLGVVYCYSILNNCFYYEIQASEWRGKLGMQSAKRKREEYKQLSKQYVLDNFGIEVTDDESDSICIGIGYIKLFETKEC